MTIETELKLRLAPKMNAVLRRWITTHFPASPPKTEQLVSVYYDTPELALAQRDIGLRLRKVDDGWLQTLKLPEQAGAGLHQRPEEEIAVAGPALELDRIENPQVQQLLSADAVQATLEPLFTTDIQRTCWTVQDHQGNTLELSLDHGSVQSQKQSQKINELEIELKQGEVNAVFDMALRLAHSFPLIPDPQSKAERGYTLYRNTSPLAPSKAQTPTLRPKMTPQQALQTVVQETLRHLQSNVPGILGSDDAECVHQARVALRRLRSTQKAFGEVAQDKEWDSLMDEVQWLATSLGNVRDLDVFLSETLSRIEAELKTDIDFGPLKSAMQARRERCRREARADLASTRYGTLLLRLLVRLNQPPQATKGKAIKLLKFADRSMNQRWRSVDRLARKWKKLSQEQRHDLRKRAKKLRYSAEFFSPLYKRKRVERYLERLQDLQQILGEMNDSMAAQALLAQFIAEDPTLEHAAGLVTGWLAHGAKRSETALARVLRRLENTSAFWEQKKT